MSEENASYASGGLTFYGLVADLEKLQSAQEHMQVQMMKLAHSNPKLAGDARFQEIQGQMKTSLENFEQIIRKYRQKSDQDLMMNDDELAALAAQLETTVPTDIVTTEFRYSLLSKLIDIQASGS